MSRYGGMKLVDVARIPFEAHQDLMEAARLNTVSPDDIEGGKNVSKAPATDRDVAAFFGSVRH